MRDAAQIMGGEALTMAPHLFIGAVENPFADPFKYRVARLATKVDAGAEFIQTQCIFNLNRFKKWIELAKDEGLDNKVYILGESRRSSLLAWQSTWQSRLPAWKFLKRSSEG
jgi:methylenetetrahydrofolate reductase (NADPH)